MRKIFLIAVFLCAISCKKATTENSNLNTTLDKAGADETENPVIDSKVKSIENTIKEEITDTLSTTEKSITTAPVIKKEASDIKVTTVSEKKEGIIEEPKTVAKEIIEKKVEKVAEVAVITKANHEAWDKLSKVYVSSNGKVNYKGFKTKLTAIDSYLLHLQNTPPTKTWSKNEKLAYWFNLYNASTVHLIVTNYPVKSIKDINGGKPWDKKFIKSGTHLYSLNDIENTIVRPNYNEPRLHVAFNCAAVSCPNLLNGAFLPMKLNTQLNSLSKKWLVNTSKNKITGDAIEISQIFDWYKGDFKAGVINFINKHNTLKVNPTATVTYMKYNWELNE